MSRLQFDFAVQNLRKGGVIAYPTESVYGLGCDATCLEAVARILSIKQRPIHKGLILLVNRIEQAQDILAPLTQSQIAQLNKPSKRATTWLLNKNPSISLLLSGEHEKLAVRVTTHPLAKKLCEAIDSPLVSTSCNLASKPTSRSTRFIRNKFKNKVDMILSGQCGGQEASRLIDFETGKVLRG